MLLPVLYQCVLSLTAWSLLVSAVICPDIGSIKYADVIPSQDPPFTSGTVLKIKCDKGYKGHGVPKLKCRKDGKWSDPPPICTASKCERDEKKLEKGRKCPPICKKDSDCDQFEECECDDLCGRSCINSALRCKRLSPPENGSIEGKVLSYGYRIRYTCSDGFLLTGPAARKCRSDKKWSGRAPKCLPFGSCGLPTDTDQSGISGKVVEGKNAEEGAWPWQVILFYNAGHSVAQFYDNRQVFAGGTIINEKWILTAAHVFDRLISLQGATIWKSKFLITVGMTSYPDPDEEIPDHVKVFEPGSVYRHESYDYGTYDYDVALIRVGKSLMRDGMKFVVNENATDRVIKFSRHIRPVCLPCMSIDPNSPAPDIIARFSEKKCAKEVRSPTLTTAGTRVIVTGFGVTRKSGEQEPFRPRIMQEGNVKIEPDNVCLKSIRQNDPSARYTDRMLCTSSANKSLFTDACYADSGGPIVKQISTDEKTKHWIQVGIVSWGFTNVDCGKAPGFYVNLPTVMSWVWGVLGKEQEVYNCPPPEPPENGNAEYTSVAMGSVVKYFCNRRYELVGNSKSFCNVQKNWGDIPICANSHCLARGMLQCQPNVPTCLKNGLVCDVFPDCINEKGDPVKLAKCNCHLHRSTKEMVHCIRNCEKNTNKSEKSKCKNAKPCKEDRKGKTKKEKKTKRVRRSIVMNSGRIEIYFLFDLSICMEEEHLEKLIEFAKGLVVRVTKNDTANRLRFGIIAFGTESYKMLDVLDEPPKNPAKVLDTLDEIKDNYIKIQQTRTQYGKNLRWALLLLDQSQLSISYQLFYEDTVYVKRLIFIMTNGPLTVYEDASMERESIEMAYAENPPEFYSITAQYELDALAREQMQYLASKNENFIYIENPHKIHNYIDQVTDVREDHGICGKAGDVKSVGLLDRKTGVENASKGAWPWQALISPYDEDVAEAFSDRSIIGGGSLLNNKWVLTAANLFFGYGGLDWEKSFIVTLGITRRPYHTGAAEESIKMFQPEKIIVHEKYEIYDGKILPYSFQNDIALIKLGKEYILYGNRISLPHWEENGSIEYTPYIRPVCLPCSSNSCVAKILRKKNDKGEILLNGKETPEERCKIEYDYLMGKNEKNATRLIATGFWHNAARAPDDGAYIQPSRYLLQTVLKVYERERCEEAVSILNNRSEHWHHVFTDEMFCALGTRDKNGRVSAATCYGSEGGPIVREVHDDYTNKISCFVQVGIVSWGYGCRQSTYVNGEKFYYPGFYTDVTSMMSWINKTMQEND